MAFNRNRPYNDLPLLPPRGEVETKAILKKTITANRALAKLVGSGKQLPNQAILLNTIGLQEAKLSSEIENILTTNDELYQALSSGKKNIDPDTKEVLHYQDAIWEGFQYVKKNGIITTNLLIRICDIIKESNAGIRRVPGTKIANHATGEVIYTPPEGESIIREKLKNLEEYLNINDDGVDPLIKMAVSHYQFESIHPFADGNGRTGRILNILYLVNTQLLDIPILYLSKHIIDHKTSYYDGLESVTEKGEWHGWIHYVLDAIEQTSAYTQRKIDDIVTLMRETDEYVKVKCADIYSKELIEVIFRQVYCKRIFLENANIVRLKTAGLYLARLEKKGILKSVKVGKEKLFINKKLLEILKR